MMMENNITSQNRNNVKESLKYPCNRILNTNLFIFSLSTFSSTIKKDTPRTITTHSMAIERKTASCQPCSSTACNDDVINREHAVDRFAAVSCPSQVLIQTAMDAAIKLMEAKLPEFSSN